MIKESSLFRIHGKHYPCLSSYGDDLLKVVKVPSGIRDVGRLHGENEGPDAAVTSFRNARPPAPM